MTDYFGYDVHFVMNITDIDDKVRRVSSYCAKKSIHTYSHTQIIIRARQNHLIDKFRSNTAALTSELVTTVSEAWVDYVSNRVNKGLPVDEKLNAGTEEANWSQLSGLFQKHEWKQECLKRDEKFEMHFTAAVRIQPQDYFLLNKLFTRTVAF